MKQRPPFRKVYTKIIWDSKQGLYVEVYRFSDGPWISLMTNAILDMSHFRWEDDDVSESGSAFLQNEDVDHTIDGNTELDTNIRLRLHVEDTNSGGANNVQLQLQVDVDGGGFNDVTAISANVQSAAGNLVEGSDTTHRVFPGGTNFISPNSCQDEVDGVCGGAALDYVEGTADRVDAVFCFQVLSADITAAAVLTFRLTEGTGGAAIPTSLGGSGFDDNPQLNVSFAVSGDVDRLLSDSIPGELMSDNIDHKSVESPRSESDTTSGFMTDVVHQGVEKTHLEQDSTSGFMTDSLDVIVTKLRGAADSIITVDIMSVSVARLLSDSIAVEDELLRVLCRQLVAPGGDIPVLESFLSSDSAADTDTVLVLTKPAGVVSGDLLVLIAINDNGTATPQFSDNKSGWNFVFDAGDIDSGSYIGLFWRISDGTEGASESITAQSPDGWAGYYLRVSGAHATPIGPTLTGTATTDTSHDVLGVTTIVNNSLLLYVLAAPLGTAFPYSVSGTGWSEVDEQQNGPLELLSSCFGSRDLVTAGASGTATVSLSVSAQAVFAQIAIAPTSGPAVTVTDTLIVEIFKPPTLLSDSIAVADDLLREAQLCHIARNTVTLQVPSANDDGGISGASFGQSFSAIGQSGGQANSAYMRFIVPIPVFSNVTRAHIIFEPSDTDSTANVLTNLFAEDIDSSSQVTNITEWNTAVGQLTTAFTVWDNVGPWFGNTVTPNTITPSLNAVIQEIVDRAGWTQGNALSIFWLDDGSTNSHFREWKDFEAAGNEDPQLVLDWDETVAVGDSFTKVICRTLKNPVTPIPVEETFLLTHGGAGTSTSLVFDKPSGVVADDLLLIIAMNDDSTTTQQFTDNKAGWNFIGQIGSNSPDVHIGAFWKIADGGEGATETVTATTVRHWGGYYIRFSGTHFLTPIDVVNFALAGNNTVHTIPEITTTLPNTLAVYGHVNDSGGAFPFDASGAGWTESADFQADTPLGSLSGTFGTKQMPIAGLTGDVSITLNTPTNEGASYFQVALAPPPVNVEVRDNLIVERFTCKRLGFGTHTILDLQIATGDDDSRHRTDHDDQTTNPSERIGDQSGSGYEQGLRFTGVVIPDGAIITNAFLTVTSNTNNSSSPVLTDIFAHQADNSGQMLSDANWHSFVDSNLGVGVQWDITAAWSIDVEEQSPSIVTVIQELFDNGFLASEIAHIFWMSGGFTFGDQRQIWHYDGDTAKAPKLRIEFDSSLVIGDSLNVEIVKAPIERILSDSIEASTPTVTGISTGSDDVNTTDSTITLPIGFRGGELLVAYLSKDGGGTVTWPGDWTEVFDTPNDGNNQALSMAYHVVDGTEAPTFTVTHISEQSVHAVYRIAGAAPAARGPEATSATGAESNNPDPPDLTPTGGAKNYLWLATAGMDRGDEGPFTAAPASYTDLVTDVGGDIQGANIGTARRILNAASENPGTFTTTNPDGWVGSTTAIHPGGSVSDNFIVDIQKIDVRDLSDYLPIVPGIPIGVVYQEETGAGSHGGDFIYTTKFTVDGSNFDANTEYVMILRAQVGGTNNTGTYKFRTRIGSTTPQGSEMIMKPFAGSSDRKHPYFYFHKFTTAGSPEDITFQIAPDSNITHTAQSDNHVFWAFKLADLDTSDWAYGEDTGTNTHTTGSTYTNQASITFTPTVASNEWLVIGWGSVESAEATAWRYRINFDSDTETVPELRYTAGAGGLNQFWPWALVRPYTLTDSSHTFTIQSNDPNVVTTQNDHKISKIFTLRLDAFENHVASWISGNFTPPDNNPNEIADLAITPTSSVPVVVLGNILADANGGQRRAKLRVQFDGVTTPFDSDSKYDNDANNSNDEMPIQVVAQINGTAGTLLDVDVDVQINTAGILIKDRGFAAIALVKSGVPTDTFIAEFVRGPTVVDRTLSDSLAVADTLLVERQHCFIARNVTDYQISASGDDVFHRGGDHTLDIVSINFHAGNNAASGTFTLFDAAGRFIVALPKPVNIVSANLVLTPRNAGSAGVVRTNIQAEDVDNSGQITTEADWHVRIGQLTTATIAWDNIGSWSVDVVNANTTSPNISTVVQEVVDRSGWVSGNAVNVFWLNDGSDLAAGVTRRADSYDNNPAQAPILRITWDETVAVGDSFTKEICRQITDLKTGAITRLTKADATERSTTSQIETEITQRTIPWSDLTAAGFAADDVVFILWNWSLGAASLSINVQCNMRHGTAFSGGTEWLPIDARVEAQGTNPLNAHRHFGWVEQHTLVVNENIYFSMNTVSAGTARSANFTCTLIKKSDLAAGDWRYDSQANALALTTDFADGRDAQITLPSVGGSDWLIFGCGNWNPGSVGEQLEQRLNVDGVSTVMTVSHEPEDAAEQFPFMCVYPLQSAAASQTVTFEGRVDATSSHVLDSSHLLALRLGAFADYIVKHNTTTDALSTTPDTYVETAKVDLELSADGDVFVVGQTIVNPVDIQADPYLRLQEGDVDIIAAMGRASDHSADNSDLIGIWVHVVGAMMAGTKTIDMDVAQDESSQTADATERTLVAFSLELAAASVTVGDSFTKEICRQLDGAASAPVDVQIAAGADDLYHRQTFHDLNIGGTNLNIGNISGVAFDSSLRFTGVTIPVGTTIAAAHMTLTAVVAESETTILTNIYAHAADASAQITIESEWHDVVDSNLTTAFTVDDDDVNVGVDEEWNTPDLSAVIQEVVDRSGFNNIIHIIWLDDVSPSSARWQPHSYNGDPAKAAKLHIEVNSDLVISDNLTVTITEPAGDTQRLLSDSLDVGESTQTDRTSTSSTLAVADVAAAVTVQQRGEADTLSGLVVDTFTTVITKARGGSDTITAEDELLRQLCLLRSDSMALEDTFEAAQTGIQVRLLSDSIEVADNLFREFSLCHLLDATFTLADEILRSLDRFLADSLAVEDASATTVESPRLISDTSILTDSDFTELFRQLADNFALADATLLEFQLCKLFSDSIEVADNVIVSIAGNIDQTLSDSIDVLDSVDTVLERNLSNTFAASDDTELSVESPRQIFDSLAVSDAAFHPVESPRIGIDALATSDTSTFPVESPRLGSDSLVTVDSEFRVLERLRGEVITLDTPDSTVIERFVLDSLAIADAIFPEIEIGKDAITSLLPNITDTVIPTITRQRGGLSILAVIDILADVRHIKPPQPEEVTIIFGERTSTVGIGGFNRQDNRLGSIIISSTVISKVVL